jgi:hypothetical protein
VNEAWLRLQSSPDLDFDSPLHFKRIAARAMRQILIEAARRRHTQKRGGDGSAIFLTLDDTAVKAVAATDKELLAVDAALDELVRMSPRQAQVVEPGYPCVHMNRLPATIGQNKGGTRLSPDTSQSGSNHIVEKPAYITKRLKNGASVACFLTRRATVVGLRSRARAILRMETPLSRSGNHAQYVGDPRPVPGPWHVVNRRSFSRSDGPAPGGRQPPGAR